MAQNSIIQWQTGTPKESGKYLITTKHHEVETDMWLSEVYEYGNRWQRHYDVDVIAWCMLENITPFKF